MIGGIKKDDFHAPMSEEFKRLLSAKAVETAKPHPKGEGDSKGKPYKLFDGGGLYLEVQPSGVKHWRYKFRLAGVENRYAIGTYPTISLARAREEHAAARKLVAAGVNPTHARQHERIEATKEQQAGALGAFQTVVETWRANTDPELRPASVRQRARELNKYLLPKLGDRNVKTITRIELTTLLRDVEKHAPETAKNLRGHLDAVFEFAIDSGLIDSNPTPPRRILKKRNSTSHPALPSGRMGEFLRAVDASLLQPQTRVAMLLTVMTAARKNEITSARWSEFDLDAGLLVVPAERMKKKRDHVVPLSTQAIALLRDLREIASPDREHLFPNRDDASRPISHRTLNAVLERLGFNDEASVHGFRSAFSTRFNELQANPDVIELCLAHTKAGIRGVYNRALLLNERKKMLQDWADWLDQQRGSPTLPPLAMAKPSSIQRVSARTDNTLPAALASPSHTQLLQQRHGVST